MKKKSSVIIALILCICMLFPMTVSASMADDAVEYVWGNTYSAKLNSRSEKYYTFDLSKKSNLYMKLTSDVQYQNGCWATIYNTSGKVLVNSDDFTATYNSVTGIVTQETTRTLPAGTYYVKIRSQGAYTVNYSLFATSEPAITLSRPKISSLQNSASKKITVKVSSVKNRTGYQFQYATNSKFTNAKTVKGGLTKTISKLSKGKTYYIRVRAYTIYGAGNTVYSAWSPVRYIKIKK